MQQSFCSTVARIIELVAGYRRSVKVVSPQAEDNFEDENGEGADIFEDEVPYDLKAPGLRFQEKIMVSVLICRRTPL